MNRRYHWVVPLVAGLVGCGAGSSPSAVTLPAEVGLQVVKMPEFKKAVAAQKGMVVVIDVWADY